MKDKKIKSLFDDWMKSDDMSADEVAFVKQYYDETDDTEFLAHGFYAGYCLADKHTKSCRWTEDADGIWHTSCGQAHEFTTGTPEENDHLYCPYCGHVLDVSR